MLESFLRWKWIRQQSSSCRPWRGLWLCAATSATGLPFSGPRRLIDRLRGVRIGHMPIGQMSAAAPGLGQQHDLAELAAGRRSARRPARPRRAGTWPRPAPSTAPASNSGSTSRSTSRAALAFSSSGRARSVEPWMRPRLPISASRLSSALAPLPPTPITAMRPPVASALRLPARLGAPTSSSTTSKGPCVLEALRSDRPSRRAPPPAARSSSLRTVAVTRAPAARPSCTAAVPTPPAAPCTQQPLARRSPAWVKSASWAVVKTSGKPPACGQSSAVRAPASRRARARAPARPGRRRRRPPSPGRPPRSGSAPGPSADHLAGQLHAGDVRRRAGRRRVARPCAGACRRRSGRPPRTRTSSSPVPGSGSGRSSTTSLPSSIVTARTPGMLVRAIRRSRRGSPTVRVAMPISVELDGQMRAHVSCVHRPPLWREAAHRARGRGAAARPGLARRRASRRPRPARCC